MPEWLQSDACYFSCLLTKYNLREELSTQIRTKADYLAGLTNKVRSLQCVWDRDEDKGFDKDAEIITTSTGESFQ